MSAPVRPAVLLVDDDTTLADAVARRLTREGYTVRTADSGPAALQALDEGWPALLVVDLMMPGMDGFELCRRVKRIADLPIIVLSAVAAPEAKVSALELYAEDYVTKPFDSDELVARIQRVLRRSAPTSSQLTVDDGEVAIDLARRQVRTRDGMQQLTPTEARLLSVVIGAGGRVVPTEDILERVWSEADGADPSYVWVTIRRLRRKLETNPDEPRYLLTERGVGYRFAGRSALGVA